jgi:WD40 repeat protein
MEQDPVVDRQLQGHKAAVNCISFNPRDKSIATGDNANIVMVWSLKKSATALK